ncbi:IS3 family transposase [Chitinophaga sp. Hz27]|uniref:IS3 family transposase n=1 Tax=Chitinophaga sp. Hz27 TaxID=3347169 RepID=UPI0035E222E1
MGYTRQAYYKNRADRVRRLEDLKVVRDQVMSIRGIMPRLGTRKLYYLIKPLMDKQSIKMGRDTLFNFLRAEHLLIRPRKTYTRTTNSKHWLKKYPNLTKTLVITKPEQLWVTDITYLKTTEGNMYLNMITDAYSRKIVGYSVSNGMEASSMVPALKMALQARIYKHTLVHHSDRGLQYCSREYTDIAVGANLRISMTENGDPYENALAERMNRTIKEEFLLDEIRASAGNTKKIIDQSIYTYNHKRPHLALNFKTPESLHRRKNPGRQRQPG